MVKQCCGTDGVEANYIKTEILPHFFKHFWQHRMALDRRNYRQVCHEANVFFWMFVAHFYIPKIMIIGCNSQTYRDQIHIDLKEDKTMFPALYVLKHEQDC